MTSLVFGLYYPQKASPSPLQTQRCGYNSDVRFSVCFSLNGGDVDPTKQKWLSRVLTSIEFKIDSLAAIVLPREQHKYVHAWINVGTLPHL
jgi:hypothetical protein